MFKSKTPSPSLVVASLALAIALGGTAYAASLPRNSVGSPQVKPNSLKGADILESTLQGVMQASGNGRAASKLLSPDAPGFVTLVQVPNVGRIEVNCVGAANASQIRFVNTTNSPAVEWIQTTDDLFFAGIPANSAGSTFSTPENTRELRTWFVRTTAPRRLTVFTIASHVTAIVGCNNYAVAESMVGG